MIKRVSLVELYGHSEVLRTLAILFSDIGWQLKLFTKSPVRSDLYEFEENANIKWITQSKETKWQFIAKNLDDINDSNLLIFVTLTNKPFYLSKVKFKPKSILIIHNGNTFFEPFKNIKLSLQFPEILADSLRLIRFLLFRQAFQRRQLLQQFDFLSLPSQTVTDFILNRDRNLSQKYQFVEPLPFVYFEGITQDIKKHDSWINIAIPGTVSVARKDYKVVFSAFQKLTLNSNQKIKLKLIGNAGSKGGQKIIAEFKTLENKNFELVYFNEPVSQKEFDIQLQQVDFLILPIKKSYKLGIINEKYGYTNISGGVNDMIRFGIPALINDDYPLEEDVKNMTAAYQSVDDLASLIQKWIEEEAYLSLRQNSGEILKKYHKEPVSKKLEKIIKGVLSQ